ncbi:MAG: helix-turn-helix domain-containing protein [Thermoleophilaceae bacterium]
MDRARLERFLDEGLSLEEIGRRLERDPSTVAYWLRKHGLEANGRAKHAARGGIEREVLEALVAEGLTTRAIAAELGLSQTTVRHWLARHGLRTARNRVAPPDPPEISRRCRTHGVTRYARTGSARHYRCKQCRAEAVARRRRRVKEILVAEAGGCCRLCGYDRSVTALHFHHLDPATKEFGIARGGFTRSLEKARAEARKCVLLCSNCHAEVEAGLVDYSFESVLQGA